jgi:hypothetical protein
LVGGKNVTLTVDSNTVVISASGSGEGGTTEDIEIVEGQGIDIIENIKGQKVISLEPGSITDDYIESISFDKIVQPYGKKIVLNGGNANG